MIIMIELKNISFAYEKSGILDDISLKINRGDFVAIVGANGAGKTTVSKIIRGLFKPSFGKVFVDGIDISTVKTSSLSSKIGFLFQNPDRQICKNTVAEELAFSLELTGVNKESHQELIGQITDKFGLNKNEETAFMSRGEKQLLALASAIISTPEILILDEPTTGLDYRECTVIMDTIKEMNENGTTVIMVCHDMELVLDYGKTLFVMAKGKLVAKGSPKEIFYNDDVLAKASLLPPQIIELAKFYPKLGQILSYGEFADALEREKTK